MSRADRNRKLIEQIAFSLGVTALVMEDKDLASLPLDEQTRLVYGESELRPTEEMNVAPA